MVHVPYQIMFNSWSTEFRPGQQMTKKWSTEFRPDQQMAMNWLKQLSKIWLTVIKDLVNRIQT